MTTPLNLEVEATLELEILSGRIPPGQKLPSIRVLAGQWETELVTGRRSEALRVAPDAEQITYRRQEKATALAQECIRHLRLLGYYSKEMNTLIFTSV
ncbi:MAG: hypothetical protein ACLU9S_07455 [Oscillospiraceae bacterium]|nr:GntR family transcriptional regulator [Bacillota bacterium]